jgi:2'-5' RNA ligase
MEAIRAFIAIELPESIRQQLNQIEQQIQTKAGDSARRAVRWVPTSNMHLTLKFLGEVSTANIQALARMLQNEAGRYAPFDFTISELGAFPNARRPRVVWVGSDAPAALMGLQKAIEAETRLLGYPAEGRPFSPHLTLGRITQNAHPDEVAQVARALGEMKVGRLGTVRVDTVHLFKSDLRPTGAIYTSLHSFLLSA